MMDNNSFNNDTQNQFVLSYELLCLLQWLVENDAPKLKKMITKALASGLKQEIRKSDTQSSDNHMLEEIQQSIIEFLGLLEILLIEALTEDASKQALEKNLVPTLDQIDGSVFDGATVRSSVERATAKSENNPKANPKELLLQELLKQWKPTKKMSLN